MARSKGPSRRERWEQAASRAVDALEELKAIQEDEFGPWQENLPENLASSALGEKLQTVVDLDIQGAIDIAEEARDAELPMGFGRD